MSWPDVVLRTPLVHDADQVVVLLERRGFGFRVSVDAMLATNGNWGIRQLHGKPPIFYCSESCSVEETSEV